MVLVKEKFSKFLAIQIDIEFLRCSVRLPQLTVSDVAKILKISIPLASQHLKILEQGKLLKKEKMGQKVYYKLQPGNRIAKSIIKEVL